MSLLTEKQIVELVEMASVPIYLYDKICEWNEKQQPHQALPLNWDIAPKWANVATVMVRWDGIGQTDTVPFSRYNRPLTPHPHAEMMAKYAEAAQRRRDPWVEFQVYCDFFSYWVTLEVPTFFDSAQRYRHIGDKK